MTFVPRSLDPSLCNTKSNAATLANVWHAYDAGLLTDSVNGKVAPQARIRDLNCTILNGANMKNLTLAITITMLLAAGHTGASAASTAQHTPTYDAAFASWNALPQASNKKGSTRVGGSNSKGKGSKYVGGRKGGK